MLQAEDGTQEAAQAVLCCAASVALAATTGTICLCSTASCIADTKLLAGRQEVVSVAPLLGAQAHVDAKRGRWLHIHVRPHARGLTKILRVRLLGLAARGLALECTVLQGSQAVDLRWAMEKELVNGHWVVSFGDAGAAGQAAAMLNSAAAQLRSSMSNALGPLLAAIG